MKSLEKLQEEFKALQESWEVNPLPYGKEYKKFASKWKSLQTQIRKYNSATNQMKRAGLKSTRTNIGYKIEYKGIVAEVYLTGCVTDYWQVDILEGDLDLYFVQHESKSDAVWFLFHEINALEN